MNVHSRNVGRIAERIAMNELEARGYDIIDLAYMSKTSANVDFIASKDGLSFNVQVKGGSYQAGSQPAIQYGFCTDETISGAYPFFNRKSNAALAADIVIFVAVLTPSDYRAIVMPIQAAEIAVQMNLARYYRQPKLDGGVHKPGKVWLALEKAKTPRKENLSQDQERALVLSHENCWDLLNLTSKPPATTALYHP